MNTKRKFQILNLSKLCCYRSHANQNKKFAFGPWDWRPGVSPSRHFTVPRR